MIVNVNFAKVIKETKDFIEFLINLPPRIIKMIDELASANSSRKDRMAIQRQMVGFRELAKSLQTLYFFKGNLKAYLSEMGSNPSPGHILTIKEIIEDVILSLEGIKVSLPDLELNTPDLSMEVSNRVTSAILEYKSMKSAIEGGIDVSLILDMLLKMEELKEGATGLIQKLDETRLHLDHYYG